MSNPLKRFMLITFIFLALLMIFLSSFIYSWVTDTVGGSTSVTVGEVSLDLSTNPEASVNINLTSPTFLLDPKIINLDKSTEEGRLIYQNHQDQFKDSCFKLTVTLKNTGNVNGVVGYGAGDTAKGIVLSLIDNDLNDNQNSLAGLTYVVLPHNETSDYYTYLLDKFTSLGKDTTYSNFNSLVINLNELTNVTLNSIKEVTLAPNEEIKFDVFIWQEYYDGENYVSQYDRPASGVIYKKQEFQLHLKVYFGQTGIK